MDAFNLPLTTRPDRLLELLDDVVRCAERHDHRGARASAREAAAIIRNRQRVTA